MQGFVIQSFREPPIFKWAMIVCFAASLALIAAALWLWGAVEVRGEFGEGFGLTFFGFFWIAILSLLFPWLGLSIEQDIGASHKPAALVALFGAVLALATIYAAGSLGEGPSYWNNIFSAALGTAAFFALWLVLELGGRMSASIAEERDLGSGIRFCGFVLAVALILGRAVAGDWHSESATVRDFIRDGWPAAALGLYAICVEIVLRPSRTRPFPDWRSCGLLPAVVYLSSASAWVFHLGRWEGMPK